MGASFLGRSLRQIRHSVKDYQHTRQEQYLLTIMDGPNTPKKFPAGKGQLLYAKSKVYLHLTSSKKDNVAGYLTIVKPHPDSKSDELIIAFITESDASVEDRESLDYFDLYGLDGEKFDFYASNSSDSISKAGTKGFIGHNFPHVVRFIDRPRTSSISSYSFGITINQLFTIQVRPKTTSLWQGSIVLHPKQETDRLPALFFHDDESPGTKREQKFKNKNFQPFSENKIRGNSLYWGGDRFVSCLRNYSTLRESTLESGMYLINCTQEDAMNFVPDVLNAETRLNKNDYDLNAEFTQALNTAKWTVLTGLASITGFAKKKVNEAIDNKILPQSLQKFVERPEVKKITDDFDSANVYLAKWALSVQEEAEKNRKRVIGNGYYKELIRAELGDSFVELTPLEVSRAARKEKINKQKWDSFFDSAGNLQYTTDELLEQVFHSGLDDEVRKEAWLFLLGVFPWDTTASERVQLRKSLENNYIEYKNNWMADLERQKSDAFWIDQKARIYKDLKRTDRDIELYKASDAENEADQNHDGSYSNEQDADGIETLFNNPNLLVLRDILFSYNELNANLGYVQGMCDLLSPLYYTLGDEALTFWAFSRFMERMERNFIRDLSGMKTQMVTLTELVQFMMPDLYLHLDKCDASNLFFFFRMLLVWFKRELSFEHTMDLWEVMWTDYHSSQFILFFALAILQKHSKIIITTLKRFDDILRYINDLSGNLDVQDLLTRAELLFVKFKQMVELLDRSKHNSTSSAFTKKSSMDANKTTVVSDELRKLLSREIICQKEEPRTADTPFG
jgi:TBC1 domain family member 15